ncbi:lactococcin 972 family bacteriocin [Vagococcus salmoninarum]|uniref:lactococcin 972 family bacteriocin n=1 Tax=Vagococcus salmoninarum TaxID=2739 RepID=UPI0028D4F99A|nr:lactococcin 972 family bacteriocin [Vagococcus salmoninarum]
MKKNMLLIGSLMCIMFPSSAMATESGQGYSSNKASTNQEEHFIVDGRKNTDSKISISVGGGVHEFGVSLNWLLQFTQYSNYDHETKTHSASAMMNDIYDYSGWVAKNKTAKARTAGTYSYWSNNSYWNTK